MTTRTTPGGKREADAEAGPSEYQPPDPIHPVETGPSRRDSRPSAGEHMVTRRADKWVVFASMLLALLGTMVLLGYCARATP